MTTLKPTVSVVIPCHNYGRYLADAIASALAQTHPPSQIIVIDDGSTDNTREIAQQHPAPVEYFALPHSGVSRARNEGLRRVTSDFVVFLDADDALDPQYLEKTLEAWKSANEPKPAFVYTQRVDFESVTSIYRYPDFDPVLLKFKNYIMVSALLRTELARAQEFDPLFAGGLEDYDFFLGLVEKGYSGLLLNQPLLRVRKHAGSRTITSAGPSIRWEIMCLLLNKHQSLYSRQDRHLFMQRLRHFVADRLLEQQYPAQPTSARLAALGQMIRYRSPLPAILSQLRFITCLPATPVEESPHA